ncbi:MAG: XRE family transcriptional regulator [Thermodesulfobacteriota bacterium]
MTEKKVTSDAVEWAYRELVGDDPERIVSLREERIKAQIGQQIYDLRHQAGLTQEELADLVGTEAGVINDLEEADYEGDSLSMLVRIATALSKNLEVRISTSDKGGSPEVG